jgi:uncharacterized cupin superfamily protein
VRISNLKDSLELTADGVRAVRLAEHAGAEHLGASLYELQPGEEMVFHYHVHREELMIVLKGRLSLRTAAGWEELQEGEVVAFPRGERGAHGYRNDGDEPVRLLMVSEMDGPNISVYPDTNQVVSSTPASGPGDGSGPCSTSLTRSPTTAVSAGRRSCRPRQARAGKPANSLRV